MKIDRAFVQDVDTDGRARRFLAAVVGGCRDLGLTVVVEGVERATQADVLRAMGAPLAQGYLFGRPAAPAGIDVRALPGRSPQAAAPGA